MNKDEWIWVAIRIFGIYLLVLAIISIPEEGVQNSVSQPAASQADVFVQALGEVDGHL